MNYMKDPRAIEARSFEIIDQIIYELRPDYTFENRIQEQIIKRTIHTTADFEYLDILKISEGGIGVIQSALQRGVTIYTDTKMALSGINKNKLAELGCECKCLIGEQVVAEHAKTMGMTRSMAAVDYAAKVPGEKIFVIGNAPTALFHLIESYEARAIEVTAVIGVPVGFVGAAESKETLAATQLPYILTQGRKGGSNVAAAIVNALLYTLERDER